MREPVAVCKLVEFERWQQWVAGSTVGWWMPDNFSGYQVWFDSSMMTDEGVGVLSVDGWIFSPVRNVRVRPSQERGPWDGTAGDRA